MLCGKASDGVRQGDDGGLASGERGSGNSRSPGAPFREVEFMPSLSWRPPEGRYAGLMDESVGSPIMDEAAAHTVRLSDEDILRERVAELAADLRAAAMKGDTLRITRLLSDLLQFKRLTPERRLALEGLTHLIDSMRCVRPSSASRRSGVRRLN